MDFAAADSAADSVAADLAADSAAVDSAADSAADSADSAAADSAADSADSAADSADSAADSAVDSAYNYARIHTQYRSCQCLGNRSLCRGRTCCFRRDIRSRNPVQSTCLPGPPGTGTNRTHNSSLPPPNSTRRTIDTYIRWHFVRYACRRRFAS